MGTKKKVLRSSFALVGRRSHSGSWSSLGWVLAWVLRRVLQVLLLVAPWLGPSDPSLVPLLAPEGHLFVGYFVGSFRFFVGSFGP
jgi:hypothetical protein